MITPIALTVQKDEKAWKLREQNLVRPPSNQWHRWQFIWVQRDGIMYEWSQDLGPSENFTQPGCEIPSLWEHTVAELQSIAEVHRFKDDFWQKFLREQEAESNMISEWKDQVHERHEIINNRSVFGPKHQKQRIGFDRRAALEQHR